VVAAILQRCHALKSNSVIIAPAGEIEQSCPAPEARNWMLPGRPAAALVLELPRETP
jgi:hypothetical protein